MTKAGHGMEYLNIYRFMFASNFEDVTFTNWSPMQPDNGGNEGYGEDAVIIFIADGGWNDVVTFYISNAICERGLPQLVSFGMIILLNNQPACH